MTTTSPSPSETNLDKVTSYYRTAESRLGYTAVLGGTKHFGYYRPGDNPWRFRKAMRAMEDYLAHALDLPRGAHVLDAGCGVGDVASRLASAHWLRVTGIDILDFNIRTARRRAARRNLRDALTFRQMSYAALDFPDSTFDGAYTMETLVHSDRIETVLAGLHRVLVPGGRLVHVEYSRKPEADCSPREAQVLREVNEAAAMPGWQRLDHGLLEQLLEGAGFEDVTSEDLTPQMLPMLRAFSQVARRPYARALKHGHPTKYVNAMSAVEFYDHQDCWRYRLYTARKPLGSQEPIN